MAPRSCRAADPDALFLLVEESDRLPADPAANARDTLDVELADVDGDGDLDAVVANAGANQLLINDGTGTFTQAPLPAAALPGPPGFEVPFPPCFLEVSAEAIFADIDDDGDPDIVVANENPFPSGPPGDGLYSP